MKINTLFITTFFFLLPFTTMAFVVPEKPTGFVSDYAGMLKSEEKVLLENKLSEFEKQTTNEIAIVTIKSLDGNTIENVAQDIFTKWGIGKKDKNNGVLLLISLEDRQTRIQTGYGVEPYLTDLGTSYIQSEIITPAFKQENYFVGINGTVDKMIESLNGTQIIPDGYSGGPKKSGFGINALIFLIFIFQWVIAILARSKSWWAGGVFGGIVGILISIFFVGSIIFAIPLIIILTGFGALLDFVASRAYQKNKINGGGLPWFLGGGGFGGGNNSGGGFGGFGGGMSGGGGSSGRW